MARSFLTSGILVCLTVAACTSESRPATTTPGSAGSTTTGTAGNDAAGTTGTAGADQAAGTTGSTGGAGTNGTSTAGTTGTAGTAGSTGTAGAAGTADAGTTIDASPESSDGASGACPFTLCESFGGAAPGATGSPWTIDVDKIGTVLETVTNKGRTDSSSLHVKVSAMAGVHGYITETDTLAKTGASFWGRVFIWYMIDTPGVHIVNVAVDGKMANGMAEQVRIVNVIGSHIATNRRSDDMGKGSNVGPPTGKWGCYEWHITPNSLDVYLDGTMLPISETWAEPTISLLRLGFERFSMGSAGEVWLDDIAINDAQIGCN